jgi:NAD(P)-dependent dehydrogenase (short-subunit alcohol dehydrogenase family)
MRDPPPSGRSSSRSAFDALVVASGSVAFNALTEMTDEQWQVGLQSKLMGQINLTRRHCPPERPWLHHLISGILSEEPIHWGERHHHQRCHRALRERAACELPRGIRINVVSPTVLEESMGKYADFFPGFVPVPAARVAQA